MNHQQMRDAIAAEQARIANWDEEARIKAEAKAQRAMSARRWHDSGQREYEWAAQRGREPEPVKSVPEERAEFRAQMRKASEANRFLSVILERDLSDTDLQEQWALWERQLGPEPEPETAHTTVVLRQTETHANLAGDSKRELFLWYVDNLLANLVKHAPSTWLVLAFMLKRSPADFTPFRISNEGIAKGAGVSARSVTKAMRYLHDQNLVLVVEEAVWSLDPKLRRSAVYLVVQLEKVKRRSREKVA